MQELKLQNSILFFDENQMRSFKHALTLSLLQKYDKFDDRNKWLCSWAMVSSNTQYKQDNKNSAVKEKI